jgi:hypothetical protein
MRSAKFFVAILLLILLAAPVVFAAPQGKGSAILTGTVLGPDDRPVAHASVSYQSSGGNAPHAVHTDSRGIFTITKLRADNYDIRASGKGVFSEWEKNVTLRTGQRKELTLRLIYARKIPKAYVKSKPRQ